jgi:DNA-binding PadR family transcriptional regulator
MVERKSLTDFEQILLGLLARGPSSGYELKKLFATTPAVVYQPSSGALYPALRRLERRGLLRAEQVPSAGRRRQRRYRLTPAGQAAHVSWLRQPVEPSTVGADLGTHLMRFVMAEGVLSDAEVLSFLEGLASALEVFIASITGYLATTPLPGRHPRLALRHGIEVHQASLDWARSAIQTLQATEQASGHDTTSRPLRSLGR